MARHLSFYQMVAVIHEPLKFGAARADEPTPDLLLERYFQLAEENPTRLGGGEFRSA
jgi:hypothetical protein